MKELGFAWHMPSFPVDGSSGPDFWQQTLRVLERIEGHYDGAFSDDHFWTWAEWQDPDTPYMECLTTITYLAALFPKMRFGATVFCQGYRTPGIYAKLGANLQLITQGRFVMGIGAGWMGREFAAYGYDFPKPAVRIAQLEESVQIIRKLWTESPASFEGKHYRIKDAYCAPMPDPLPPLMIGGAGEQLTLRVVAKHADWWNIGGGTVENYAHKLQVLREHCDKIGRDEREIKKTWSPFATSIAETEAEAKRIGEASPFRANQIVGTPEQVAERYMKAVEAGVEYFIMRFVDFPSPHGMELFAQEVIPLLRRG